nr:hypothetical protein [Tanacetum cinerariifolium]
AGGSSEEAGLEPEVPNEKKGKSIDTSHGTSLKPRVPNVSKANSSKSEYKSWGDSDDDDQQGDDERTKFDNDKAADHNKTDDEEEDEFVAGDQVKDVDQETFTAAPTIQKTKVPLPSSSISSDYATKFLNFNNMSLADTKIISMMDIKVQHEDPSSYTSPLLTVAVLSKIPTVVKEYLGTSMDDTLHKVIQRHTTKLIKEHSLPGGVIEMLQQHQKHQKRAVDTRKIKMEQAGKQQNTKYIITSSNTAELQEFDQTRTLFETMTKTKSFNKITKHKALYHALKGFILKDEDAMDKGIADKPKKRNLDDADRDKGPPAEPNQRLKRKKTSKDVKPSKKAKYIKTSKGITKIAAKSTGKSAQVEEGVFEARENQVPQNLGEDMGNTDEPPVVNAGPKDWFKKPKRPATLDLAWNKYWNNPEGDRYTFDLSKPLPLVQSRNRQIFLVDYFFNIDLAYMQGGSTDRTYITSLTKTKAVKYDLQGIKDVVPNLWSPVKVAYNRHALLGTSHWRSKRQTFYGYASNRVSKHDVYFTKRILANILFNLKGKDIVHLAAALRTNLEQTAETNLVQAAGIDLEQTAGTDLEQTAETDLVQAVGTNLEQTAETDLVQAAGTDLEQTAGTDLEQIAETDLEQTTGTDLEQTARTDLVQSAGTDLESLELCTMVVSSSLIILLGLPEDIYAAVDSCKTAQEIWLRVQQMMKGSDIGIQEKKAKLFNEWESIESYYHHFLKLMNDLKRNKHFPEKIARNLVGYNDVIRNQDMQNAIQNPRIRNGNLVAARAEGNAAGQNGNQIRCYKCRGKKEAGIQLQAEEYDLMAAAADLDEIKK